MTNGQQEAKDGTAEAAPPTDAEREAARAHLQALGRNDPCWCKSGKKYKKCHLLTDEQLGARPPAEPDAAELIARGWRLFEQRRPGAAEREFRAALAKDASSADAQVGIGMAKLQSGEADDARTELEKAVGMSDEVAEKMKQEKVKDAFMRPEAQAYVRACMRSAAWRSTRTATRTRSRICRASIRSTRAPWAPRRASSPPRPTPSWKSRTRR